jgi:hypothetical protein
MRLHQDRLGVVVLHVRVCQALMRQGRERGGGGVTPGYEPFALHAPSGDISPSRHSRSDFTPGRPL